MRRGIGEKLATGLRVSTRASMTVGWTLFSHWRVRARQAVSFRPFEEMRCLDIVSDWGRGLGWIMGVEIVEKNERTGPMGDVIIANHMGFLDIPVLLNYYPAVFIIKATIGKVPYVGTALRRGGHIFVERGDADSRKKARDGLRKILEDGDRVIIFPEGRASPGVERRPFKPFSFIEAARQSKRVEACIIDYLPDRQAVRWDINRKTLPQLFEIIGRRRTMVSVEFIPAEIARDPVEMAQRYHDLIEERLASYDRDKEMAEAA